MIQTNKILQVMTLFNANNFRRIIILLFNYQTCHFQLLKNKIFLFGFEKYFISIGHKISSPNLWAVWSVFWWLYQNYKNLRIQAPLIYSLSLNNTFLSNDWENSDSQQIRREEGRGKKDIRTYSSGCPWQTYDWLTWQENYLGRIVENQTRNEKAMLSSYWH